MLKDWDPLIVRKNTKIRELSKISDTKLKTKNILMVNSNVLSLVISLKINKYEMGYHGTKSLIK
jgi:hypothetical protein